MSKGKCSTQSFIERSSTLGRLSVLMDESPKKGSSKLKEKITKLKNSLKRKEQHNDELHQKLFQANQQVIGLKAEGWRLKEENEKLALENKISEGENQKLKEKIKAQKMSLRGQNKLEKDLQEFKKKQEKQRSRIKQLEQIVINLKQYIIQRQILDSQSQAQESEWEVWDKRNSSEMEKNDCKEEANFMIKDGENLLQKRLRKVEINERYDNQVAQVDSCEDDKSIIFQLSFGIEKIENLRERIGRVENEKGLMEKELSDGKKTVKVLKERLIKSLEQYEELSGKHHTAMKSNIELQRDMERELFDLNLSVKANMKEELKTTGSFSPRMTMPTSLKYID